jgi:membrane protease YdiL (CAAX protease family)
VSAVVLAAALFTIAAAMSGRPGTAWADVATYAAVFLLMLPFLGSGSHRIGLAARGGAGRPGAALAVAAALTLPGIALLASRGGLEEPVDFAAAILYGAFPLLLLAWARRAGPPPCAADWIALAAAWLPVEWSLIGDRWLLRGGSFPAPMAAWLAACVLLAGFKTIRPLEGIGLRWRLRAEDLAVGSIALVAVLAVLLPADLALGMGPASGAPDQLATGVIGLLIAVIFVVLPAELFFRGLVFNLLQRIFVSRHGPRPALVLSAALFALSALGGRSAGGWWPVAFAAYAGLWYGWCYLRTGSLSAGVLAHTGVLLLERLVVGSTQAPP